jgi:hypothetical protein
VALVVALFARAPREAAGAAEAVAALVAGWRAVTADARARSRALRPGGASPIAAQARLRLGQEAAAPAGSPASGAAPDPAIRELVSGVRHRAAPPGPGPALRRARPTGPALSREDLRLMMVRARVPEVFVAPEFIPDFLCGYVRARGSRPRMVVDLWAAAGWMLPPVVDALRPARAIGILPGGRGGELVGLVDPADRITWRADDAPVAAAALERGVDLVLGCPPWHWQPRRLRVRTADAPLVLADDPANVALLEACTRLAPDGIGLFVVGPGFIMRPGRGTAFANLGRMGLSLHLLLALPRGIFSPDSGSGRLLAGIAPAPCAAPLVGSLTPDPRATAALLDAVRPTSGT